MSKIYQWETSTGMFDSFSRLNDSYNNNPFEWYQAIEREDNFKPTIVKYVCSCCNEIVVGITLFEYDENNKPIINLNIDIDLNNIMLHKYDFQPEEFMLSQKQIDEEDDISMFEDEFEDAYRDMGDLSFQEDEYIYNFFQNEQINITTPIIDLTNLSNLSKIDICLKQLHEWLYNKFYINLNEEDYAIIETILNKYKDQSEETENFLNN